MHKPSRRWRSTLPATMLFLSAVCASAQTTESEVAARLKGKSLYLRGSWVEDKLNFDADGKPLKPYKSLPFTEAGFDFQSARWRGDVLIISGRRTALGFDEKGRQKRIPLRMPDYDGNMTVTLQAPAGTNCGRAVDAIFASDLADLTPSLPSYWQPYAKAHFLLPGTAAPIALEKGLNTEVQDSGAQKVGGSVKPPRVLKSGEPAFTQVARALRFSGKVQVYLWIDEHGIPSHLKIARPAGLGLDEAALVAVQAYRFTPATQDGKPVKVDLYIDVDFQIF